MENEIWKSVPGFEEYYKVSNFGKVIRIKGTQVVRVLKGTLRDGYLGVNLYKNGKQARFTIHRLVAITFISNPDNKPCVNHINGVKTDNRVENLEWVTIKENIQHAWRTGLIDKDKWSAWRKGRHLSDKHKESVGKAKRGNVWVNNGIENHMIKPEKLQDYLNRGYVLGMKTVRGRF